MRPLSIHILVIAVGSLALYMLPDLPGGAHLVLQGLWLLGVWIVLTLQLVRLIGDNSHLLFAHLGCRTAKAPASYVRALFDDYARRFDHHLMMDLDYVAPNLVRGMVGRHAIVSAPVVVDLGCGTGICGPLFRPLAERLIGVDLSPNMLEVACRRKVYDALIETDIVDYLRRHPDRFDLCFAADVLVYLGDLRPLFAASAAALRPGGYFAFTVESTTRRDWILQRTGRYAHSRGHIRELARRCGFEIVALERATLRIQHDRPVAGDIWLLRRNGADRGRVNPRSRSCA